MLNFKGEKFTEKGVKFYVKMTGKKLIFNFQGEKLTGKKLMFNFQVKN